MLDGAFQPDGISERVIAAWNSAKRGEE